MTEVSFLTIELNLSSGVMALVLDDSVVLTGTPTLRIFPIHTHIAIKRSTGGGLIHFQRDWELDPDYLSDPRIPMTGTIHWVEGQKPCFLMNGRACYAFRRK
jgi:hypothetical protein